MDKNNTLEYWKPEAKIKMKKVNLECLCVSMHLEGKRKLKTYISLYLA